MTRKTPEAIRAARATHPEMRARDFARIHAISEAELLAAHTGDGVVRLRPDVPALLTGLSRVGEVMALTRNESLVHEKIGTYDEVVVGDGTAMVLGPQIDLRVFPSRWAHAFVTTTSGEDGVRRSLQMFDRQGNSVHKVHARAATDLSAWEALVASLRHEDQGDAVVIEPPAAAPAKGAPADAATLRQRWAAITDQHQFHGLLRDLNLTRLEALNLAGTDKAWPLDTGAVRQVFEQAASSAVPIMVFAGNPGCIQIHTGPVHTITPMGPWLNVMDPTFHMHLRLDHIAGVWAVRKPNRTGHVTSVEVYDAAGELIVQLFGQRQEGTDERPAWRALVESLPAAPATNAA